jgi:hypothetical protein
MGVSLIPNRFRTILSDHLVLHLILLTFIFCFIFATLRFILHIPHQVSVFISFLLFPFLFLACVPFNDLKKRISLDPRNVTRCDPVPVLRSLGGIDRGFLAGILLYLVFAGYVFAYYQRDPDFFTGYDKQGTALLSFIFLTALNVMPVDFFTKRFIQLPLSNAYGPGIALGLQTLVWLLAHIPESLWLDELMGPVGVWVFLFFSGLTTGIIYERTKNVSGMMVGHVLLNVLVVGMARL